MRVKDGTGKETLEQDASTDVHEDVHNEEAENQEELTPQGAKESSDLGPLEPTDVYPLPLNLLGPPTQTLPYTRYGQHYMMVW